MRRTVLLAILICRGAVGTAQTNPASRLYASRDDLQGRLQLLERAANSSAYSEPLRERARREGEWLRARLEQGDFHVGDRLLIEVERESTLTDTFTVAAGPGIQLPVVGDVPLAGILRAELATHLTGLLQRFVREPRIRVRPLVRVGVEGAVTRPGFYTVSAEQAVADLVTIAGGATSGALLDRLRVVRAGEPADRGFEVDLGLSEGLSIDQLGVQAGDRIFVPARGRGLGGFEGPVRVLSIALSLPLTIFAVTQIF
jgi:hypothetical protein